MRRRVGSALGRPTPPPQGAYRGPMGGQSGVRGSQSGGAGDVVERRALPGVEPHHGRTSWYPGAPDRLVGPAAAARTLTACTPSHLSRRGVVEGRPAWWAAPAALAHRRFLASATELRRRSVAGHVRQPQIIGRPAVGGLMLPALVPVDPLRSHAAVRVGGHWPGGAA